MTAVSSGYASFPGLVEGLPNICGWGSDVEAVTSQPSPVFLPQTNLRLADISAGFAIALHMHQPTIPAGKNGELINNLQYMFEHPYSGDNHNAGPFAYCYGRMGDFIPELVNQGCNPRVMLDYTGTLLWGLQQMGREDILGKLKRLTDPVYRPYVEWLGTFWGHGVASTIPLRDIKLHIQAWQHHFAAIFGTEALGRVRGFSLPEMQLPNHHETLYVLIRALQDCGYQWLMVQAQTIETLNGESIRAPHLPHRLIVRGETGEVAEMAVLIKAQGLSASLVDKMQPYYEAKTLSPVTLEGKRILPVVTQIADGENGGTMMNEFPSAFKRAWYSMGNSKQGTVAFTGTEYLELLTAAGFRLEDFPACRAAAPSQQQKNDLQVTDAALTDDRHLVEARREILELVENLSDRFHSVVDALSDEQSTIKRQHRYRNALLHNLLLQTSCFRHWGQGDWTDYAKEIYRRGIAILENDF